MDLNKGDTVEIYHELSFDNYNKQIKRGIFLGETNSGNIFINSSKMREKSDGSLVTGFHIKHPNFRYVSPCRTVLIEKNIIGRIEEAQKRFECQLIQLCSGGYRAV
jgi:hypothetical protein